MYQSSCSTLSIIFMFMCTISTKPMHLNGQLDTELKLGTSTLGTIPIPELDSADPSRITLSPPSTISRLEKDGIQDSDALKLTLAPPSGFTSQKTIPKATLSRIEHNNRFKHTSSYQHKQPFRITPDGKLWLGDQVVQLTKPVSRLQEHYPGTMPHKNLMFEAYPSSFPTHQLQGSGSRDLDIRKVPSHSVPRFPGEGSNSVQGVSTPKPSTEDLENLMEDPHHDIIHLPSFGTRGSVQNVGKSFLPMRENMYNLAAYGRDEFRKRAAFHEEILQWFAALESRLTQRIKEKDSVEIVTSTDIKKALNRAQVKLTTIFLGYLITNHKALGGKSDEQLLREGWTYLKRYMIQWKNANLEVIGKLKGIKADPYVYHWTSDYMFAYFMSMDEKTTLSSKVLSRFIAGWKQLNGVS